MFPFKELEYLFFFLGFHSTGFHFQLIIWYVFVDTFWFSLNRKHVDRIMFNALFKIMVSFWEKLYKANSMDLAKIMVLNSYLMITINILNCMAKSACDNSYIFDAKRDVLDIIG